MYKRQGVRCVYETVAYVSNIKIVLGNFPRVCEWYLTLFLNKRDCPGSDNRRKSGETHQIRINGDKVQTQHINVAIKLISFWGSQVMGHKCEARCTPCEHW